MHYNFGPITIRWDDDEQTGKPTNIVVEGMSQNYHVIYDPLSSEWCLDWTTADEHDENVKYFYIRFNNAERNRALAEGDIDLYEDLTPCFSIGDYDYDDTEIIQDEDTKQIVISYIREHFPPPLQFPQQPQPQD